jgi:hypothetical protein
MELVVRFLPSPDHALPSDNSLTLQHTYALNRSKEGTLASQCVLTQICTHPGENE